MKRLTIYPIFVLVLGAMALMFAHHAQTQNTPADTAVPDAEAGGATTPVFSYQGQLLDAQGNPMTGSVPMTFRLFPTATGGTACWTEAHTGGNVVVVADGRFSILLGSIIPANADCLANDAYLELQINGETLTPRQLLTSVAETVTLSAEAITKGNVQLGGDLNVAGHNILNIGNEIRVSSGIPNFQIVNEYGTTRLVASSSIYMFMDADNNSTDAAFTLYKNAGLLVPPVETVFRVEESGNTTIAGNLIANGRIYTRNGADLGLQDNGGGYLSLGNNPGDNKIYLEAFSTDGSASADEFLITGRFAAPMPLFTIRADQTNISGNLNVGGTCNASVEGDDVAASVETCTAVRIGNGSIQTGGIIESNLMTPEERAAGVIDRFAQGDLLCWSAADRRLEKCTQAHDRLVQAVADRNGLPIVAGAEPIKVIGPVKAGDYLVASSVPGYAMVAPDPTFGIVIAQALEDFNGVRGLILAFIRKM